MTQNIGPLDQGIRVVAAFGLALLALSLGFGTAIGIVLLVVAGVLAVTAATGFCPLYVPFGISTRRPHRHVGA